MNNPYVMPFTQGQEFANWQRYAGETNKQTGEFQFGMPKKPEEAAIQPPTAPEVVMPDYTPSAGIAPTSSLGIKPVAALGMPASTMGVTKPTYGTSLLDAVSKHLGE
jgi:hypothetical protein